MLQTEDILRTIQMLHTEHLDVRTVTLGLDVTDCAGPNIETLCTKLRNKILSRASGLVEVCQRVGSEYGIPVINKRLAISPVTGLLGGHGRAGALEVAKVLDDTAGECGVDLIGGFTALVQKGMTPTDELVISSLPAVLSQTKRVCASINVASRKAGINTGRVLSVAYILCGLLAAVGGFVSVAQLGNVNSGYGEGYEFYAIAAAVLGGASLFGGIGDVFPGTVLGATLIQMVSTGLVFTQVDLYLQPLVQAATIFVAVLIDSFRSRKLAKIGRRNIRVEDTD